MAGQKEWRQAKIMCYSKTKCSSADPTSFRQKKVSDTFLADCVELQIAQTSKKVSDTFLAVRRPQRVKL